MANWKPGDVMNTKPCPVPGCKGTIVQTYVQRRKVPSPSDPGYEIDVSNITCTVGGDDHLKYAKGVPPKDSP